MDWTSHELHCFQAFALGAIAMLIIWIVTDAIEDRKG